MKSYAKCWKLSKQRGVEEKTRSCGVHPRPQTPTVLSQSEKPTWQKSSNNDKKFFIDSQIKLKITIAGKGKQLKDVTTRIYLAIR